MKDLKTISPSASFHVTKLEHLKNGTINHIEGSMNGPIDRFVSKGNMKGTGVLHLMVEEFRQFKMVAKSLILLSWQQSIITLANANALE